MQPCLLFLPATTTIIYPQHIDSPIVFQRPHHPAANVAQAFPTLKGLPNMASSAHLQTTFWMLPMYLNNWWHLHLGGGLLGLQKWQEETFLL